MRHVGDTLSITVRPEPGMAPDDGWQPRLRTTLGRARLFQEDIVRAHTSRVPPFGACWHDIPLPWDGAAWSRQLLLTEVGYFSAKPYLLDPQGRQHWPAGPDIGITVHPDWARSANTLYCAFVRLFGKTRGAVRLQPEETETLTAALEATGHAVLPPSGTFRDLIRQLPHIVQDLGCRILHLLPIHPTPTVYARFGRFGSPYAALDLTSVDPALVEFDHRTTGIDQFCELTRATHELGARVFLDLVVNHTGWGSRLFEQSPEFFRRESDGRFASPGAWGVVWEDLVELEQRDVALWDLFAEALLTWCRRGVDGFRCDAGYKIPTHVWQYVIARVRTEFPDTVFLLEGLGGSWEATETLLTTGGMQWAYSELFQNYSGGEIQRYLDYALKQSERVGTYVHYSETHDNDRLAARGRTWSLLRNQLCALTSVNGGFGFTCGVEWLADEKIRVHQRTGLAWDQPDHLVSELAALNRLLADHPAFFDGAKLRRVSPPESPVFALERRSRDDQNRVLVLVNTLLDTEADWSPAPEDPDLAGPWTFELLGQSLPTQTVVDGRPTLQLAPAEVVCLASQPPPLPGSGERYRERCARVAWGLQALTTLISPERLQPGETASDAVDAAVRQDPARWLAAVSQCAREASSTGPLLPLAEVVKTWESANPFPAVTHWSPTDAPRITLVPSGWWLLLTDPQPFRAHLRVDGGQREEHATAIRAGDVYIACFPPRQLPTAVNARLTVERHSDQTAHLEASVRWLGDSPSPATAPDLDGLALLTNGRGGMARLRVDFGQVRSKYDCALGANLHPEVPVDRHVFVKRVRAWVNADGFVTALDRHNLAEFDAGPPARWRFRANAGNSRRVTLAIEAHMPAGRNTTVLRLTRLPEDEPLAAAVILRVDIEDRSYHGETHRNPGADHHFGTHCQTLEDAVGFTFTPSPDRHLRVTTDRGTYHSEPEWSEHVSHPEELRRGQVAEGDAYSPGWFEIPLRPGDQVFLTLDAENELWVPYSGPVDDFNPSLAPADWHFEQQLLLAVDAYLARRGTGSTVVAGYPWFLDWGRDTLIAARGLLAAGRVTDVLGILRVFSRFASQGTLPNSIFGENATNRDTSDAPLWFAVVAGEAARHLGAEILLSRKKSEPTPSLLETVRLLVEGYLSGTPNGIRVDPGSNLVWSPSHFTWMDTNYPAGTPREGYPVEIQALWIQALQLLAHHDTPRAAHWGRLAAQAEASIQSLFWLPQEGWYSDVLLASAGQSAADATPDTSLRSNVLFLAAFGIATGDRAQQSVLAALRHLAVPGGVRSLAPLPVSPPLAIVSPQGQPLNDPDHPYWGRYEGDEDTRRKPAYHNGTAWVWTLPVLAEALACAWNDAPPARAAARSLLTSVDTVLHQGCHGHLPEILDGDAPHTPRGCDAQAWSLTETLRVWRALRDGS